MEFRILGPLEALDGQRTVRLGGAKQRALLGVLLLHANEVVSTTRLVDELWGERPPATADKLVQGYVHALRKQLGADALVTQAPGYKLRLDPRALDLLEFERLTEDARGAGLDEAIELRRQALSLWRGPPLADVALEGPARHTVGRLSELRLATQIERIDAELELGRHAQLIGELESLVAANPYQERLHAQLMLALYRSGRQAEALHAYQAVRRTLSNELGLQPSQELRDLQAAILRQDESLSIDGRAVPAPPSPTEPQKPPRPLDEPPRALRLRRPRGRSAALLLASLVGVAAAATAALLLRDEPVPVTAPPNRGRTRSWTRSRSDRDRARWPRERGRSGSATSTARRCGGSIPTRGRSSRRSSFRRLPPGSPSGSVRCGSRMAGVGSSRASIRTSTA